MNEVLPKLENQGITASPVPWYSEAFTSDKPLGKTQEHLNGGIYIQGLSSMLPPLAIENELSSAVTVLDACAAPGSKTTQIAAMMRNTGQLVANDSSRGRINALLANLKRCGVKNAVVSNYDLRKFPGGRKFDVIVLDVPCSAEGTFMDNQNAVRAWSEKRIRVLSRLQKELLLKSFSLLLPGGVMVYSTCTFAPEENEMVVGKLLETESAAKLEIIILDGIKLSDGITLWNKKRLNPELSKCARVWPHVNNGMEGFFLARIRKNEA